MELPALKGKDAEKPEKERIAHKVFVPFMHAFQNGMEKETDMGNGNGLGQRSDQYVVEHGDADVRAFASAFSFLPFSPGDRQR